MAFKLKWVGVERMQVTFAELDKKIEEFKKQGLHEIEKNSSLSAWASGAFSIDNSKMRAENDGLKTLYVYTPENGFAIYWACKTTTTKVKAQQLHVGSLIKAKFQEIEGKRMRDIFGTVSSDDYRRLIPKPVYYIDKRFTFMNVSKVKVIDVTSMYPWASMGDMPTIKGAKTLNGCVAPSSDFPFAFYLKSGHVAEYKRFDTHDYEDFKKIPKNLAQFLLVETSTSGHLIQKYKSIPDSDEITVLMPKAKKQLTNTFLYFYDLKNAAAKDSDDYNLAKFVMNAGIGCLHRNPAKHGLNEMPDYYHIAAIIKGRANAKIIETYKQILDNGNLPLQIIVDSVIYIEGNADNLGIKDKKLGEFKIEYSNVNYRSNGLLNRYVLFDKNDNLLKITLSGYENGIEKIKRPEDIDEYVKER